MNKFHSQPQIWIVGALWGGHDCRDQKFVAGQYWMLGWDEGKQPDRASGMRPDDRIALRRMKGKGIATDLNRDIAERCRCFQSTHGLYSLDPWIREIFCL